MDAGGEDGGVCVGTHELNDGGDRKRVCVGTDELNDGGDRKRVCVGTRELNDRETSDVVILLVQDDEEERGLYAHKAVLTRHSDYFRSLFSERWNQGLEEQSMATIDTGGKGGIAKYEKFFEFIYKEPITVASLDLHGILDMLEIASELSCEAIVNACDHYLACVHWPEADLIGARLMSLYRCDKFKCSQDLAERLVEYGHPGYLSNLRQKAVEIWQKLRPLDILGREAMTKFTLMILPIVPEELVVHTILPAPSNLTRGCEIILTIFELSKEFHASNHLVIAKGVIRCLRAVPKFEGVEDKLSQLVSRLGGVEQWDVFVEWAEAGKLDWPNLRPTWLNFCQHFRHLPAVRDAALKSCRESENAYLTKLVVEMMPEVVARNFEIVSENLRLDMLPMKEGAHLMCTLCTDLLEQVTAGKLFLLDTSERFALAKQVKSLMSSASRRWSQYHYLNILEEDFASTAAKSWLKLVKTIPAEKRCDLLLEGIDDWPSIAEAFGPLQGI